MASLPTWPRLSFSLVANRDGVFQRIERFWPRGEPNSRPGHISASSEPQTQPAAPNLPQTRKNSAKYFLSQIHRASLELSVSVSSPPAWDGPTGGEQRGLSVVRDLHEQHSLRAVAAHKHLEKHPTNQHPDAHQDPPSRLITHCFLVFLCQRISSINSSFAFLIK